MNSKLFTNAIITVIFITVGYIIYVQTKQGIIISGTDAVINPFTDKTKFTNIYGGVNPYSKANHISQNELQRIKNDKTINALMIAGSTLLVLFIFMSKKVTSKGTTNLGNVITKSNNINQSVIRTNFSIFCNSLESDLQCKLSYNSDNKIEFTFPVITFGNVILNSNWKFYFGIERLNKNFEIYLFCKSKKDEKLSASRRIIDNYDLSVNEYEHYFTTMYTEILSNPKFSLITSNKI